MGLIVKELGVAGDKGQRKLRVLFDTGASVSLIRKDLAQELATLLSLPQPVRIEMGDGHLAEAREGAMLHIGIGSVTIWDAVIALDTLTEEFILGARTMQKWGIKLDTEREEILVDEDKVRRYRM